ncbi:hypothetical protein BRC19_01065 [Candidatus Saccharibacteria bacterium QS_5_54_17]|nr:MAG: hypothetical protein BRC19_01065 [Candidatus Saccharibacteria bacterium QS_5_54_17]
MSDQTDTAVHGWKWRVILSVLLLLLAGYFVRSMVLGEGNIAERLADVAGSDVRGVLLTLSGNGAIVDRSQLEKWRSEQGPQGEKGEQGEQGPQGPPGPAGEDGIDGQSGCSGGECVDLQQQTPGVSQTGHVNVSGTLRAGAIRQSGNHVCDDSNNCDYQPAGAYFVQGGNSFSALATLGTNDNNALALETGGTERVRVDTGGNVGIGTTAPVEPLHVSGNIFSSGNLTLEGGRVTIGTAATAGDITLHEGSGETGTLKVADLSQDTDYTVPDPGSASDEICLVALGNCAGSGSGVTTSGGTPDRVAKFTQSQNIEDSSIVDDGQTLGVDAGVNLNVDSGSLAVDSTDDRVGLGTTTPANRLTVSGSADITANLGIGTGSPSVALDVSGSGAFGSTVTGADAAASSEFVTLGQLNDGSDSSTDAFLQGGNSFGTLATLGTNDNNALALETGGTERVRIDTGGQVGIGTSSPGRALDIAGDMRVRGNDIQFGAGESLSAGTHFNVKSDSGYLDFRTGSSTWGYIFRQNGDITDWANLEAADSYVGLSSNSKNPQLAVTDSGNVGIGTTSPGTRLEVAGAANYRYERTGGITSNTTITRENQIVGGDSSGGAFTITLGSGMVKDGAWLAIVDEGGSAGTNPITIDTEGSETINGNSSVSLSTNREAVVLFSDGTDWFIRSRYGGGGLVDYAEYFGSKDDSVQPGDIVVPDPSHTPDQTGRADNKAFVKKSTRSYQKGLMGIVSTSPHEAIGRNLLDATDNPRPVALSGRVPVKVTDEGGPIETGDYITSASREGYGMKATQAGPVVGRALEPHAGGAGVIVVLVDNSYYTPPTAQQLQERTVTNLRVQEEAVFERELRLEGGIAGNQRTRGRVTVPAGETAARHSFAEPFEERPFVVASPATRAVRYRVETDRDGFTIHLPAKPEKPLEFTYMIQQ